MGQAVEADATITGAGVNLEFFGRDFDEGTLLGLAYAYEQSTHWRTTPPLFGELD
jgi:Asp-tRNA(Asn)/Glu-tRNA(Gln) amidotransferase A subunit family amidase